MKVLICGGAGYIGAHMCRLLAQAGHEIVVFDNLSTGHASFAKWGTFVRGDLLRAEDLERVFSAGPFDAVMHFCAKSLVAESVRDPAGYFRNNVTGTMHLLDAMAQHGTQRFIFSSSAAVYGVPQTSPIQENHPTNPINPYGRTKLLVEQLLPAYDAEFGIRSVSLRYFNAAGAAPDGQIGEDHHPETHLIPNVLLSVLGTSANKLQVFGSDYSTADGSCVRDYVHVDDIASAHLLALDYLDRGGQSEIMNLGNGEGFSVFQVIECAHRITGKPISYELAQRRPGDPPTLVASARRVKKLLKWNPQYTSLESIVETAWRWHSSRST